jgi:hypothetical protein
MQTRTRISLLATALIVAFPVMASEVPYPSGYRDWHHVKSMVIPCTHRLVASIISMATPRRCRAIARASSRMGR